MDNEQNYYKEIEADMMRLTEVDPEIGYHRCRLYSDVLINPWTGTVKSIKSGRVFDDKFRNKMVKWLVWNHCYPSSPLQPDHHLFSKDGDKSNNSITNLMVGTRSEMMRRTKQYEEEVVGDSLRILRELRELEDRETLMDTSD
jgi:hypothetical protein